MVYAHKVCRVTLSGSMWGGAEQWSTGFFLGDKDNDSVAPTQAAADAIAGYYRTLHINGNFHISSTYKFEKVKMASIGADGHTVLSEVVYSAPTTTTFGGEPTWVLPGQNALAITLTSNRPRGLAAKGRMYFPGIGVNVGVTGRLNSTDRTNIANLAKVFYDAIQGDPDIPGKLILAAKGTGAFPALTAQNDWVTHLKVGDVIDTQRRRRNGLSESYLDLAVAA
jgi:hypothetical protein